MHGEPHSLPLRTLLSIACFCSCELGDKYVMCALLVSCVYHERDCCVCMLRWTMSMGVQLLGYRSGVDIK